MADLSTSCCYNIMLSADARSTDSWNGGRIFQYQAIENSQQGNLKPFGERASILRTRNGLDPSSYSPTTIYIPLLFCLQQRTQGFDRNAVESHSRRRRHIYTPRPARKLDHKRPPRKTAPASQPYLRGLWERGRQKRRVDKR